jgi:GT2 family glycosyltransferase
MLTRKGRPRSIVGESRRGRLPGVAATTSPWVEGMSDPAPARCDSPRSTGAPPAVSLIIPLHEGNGEARRCLDSVQQHGAASAEVIVVVDGGCAEARALVEEYQNRMIVIPDQGGPAAARNAGAHAATGDVLFFVDSDVELRPDTLAQVQQAFAERPESTAVFGSYDDQPADKRFLSQYRNLLHHYVHQTAREDASTFWSGCGAIRRTEFLDAGGFDEGYRYPCVEDIELGGRLRAAGKTIRLCKDLQVKHLKRWTASRLLWADFAARALPWTELIVRTGKWRNDLNLRLSARVSTLLLFGLLAALVVSCWWPAALAVAGALAIGVLAVNAPVYAFFWRKRGAWFAMGVIPWHWLYYLSAGLAFGAGLVRHALSRRSPAGQERPNDR